MNEIKDLDCVSLIGKGSFAEVILARNRIDKELHAVKVTSLAKWKSAKDIRNAYQEAAILRSIDHPFIVKISFSHVYAGQSVIVMEFCPGGDLYYLMSLVKKMSIPSARFYAAEISLALSYLHSRSIIIRDLKPENMLVSADGHMKMCDFGMALPNVWSWTSGAKTKCGTPQYMAPEVSIGREYGQAADWWALGIISYEMVAGMPPYRGKTAKELFANCYYTKLTLLKEWPSDYKSFLIGLLSKIPTTRMGYKCTYYGQDEGGKGVMYTNGCANHVYQSDFFSADKINLEDVQGKKCEPPYAPVPFTPSLEQDVGGGNSMLYSTPDKVHGRSIEAGLAAGSSSTNPSTSNNANTIATNNNDDDSNDNSSSSSFFQAQLALPPAKKMALSRSEGENNTLTPSWRSGCATRYPHSDSELMPAAARNASSASTNTGTSTSLRASTRTSSSSSNSSASSVGSKKRGRGSSGDAVASELGAILCRGFSSEKCPPPPPPRAITTARRYGD